MHPSDSFGKKTGVMERSKVFQSPLPDGPATMCIHTHTQTAQQYLGQLQHHGVIHIEFSWNRLNEVSATHRDDAEASAKCL